MEEGKIMSEILPLKDFIVNTLTDVCEAVEEVRNKKKYVAFQHATYPTEAKATLIEFDLAVTISNANEYKSDITGEVKTSGIISVISASLKGTLSTNDEKTKTEQNRIRFSIPVDFRLDEDKYHKIQEKSDQQQSIPLNQKSSSWMG